VSDKPVSFLLKGWGRWVSPPGVPSWAVYTHLFFSHWKSQSLPQPRPDSSWMEIRAAPWGRRKLCRVKPAGHL